MLTENIAILQHVADSLSHARLAPTAPAERSRLQQWLAFIATELHKAVFGTLVDPKASEPVCNYAREKMQVRMGVLQSHLSSHEYLLDAFSVADAYLVAILNCAQATRDDLAQWPAVAAYQQRMLKRPSIAKAVGEELVPYHRSRLRPKA